MEMMGNVSKSKQLWLCLPEHFEEKKKRTVQNFNTKTRPQRKTLSKDAVRYMLETNAKSNLGDEYTTEGTAVRLMTLLITLVVLPVVLFALIVLSVVMPGPFIAFGIIMIVIGVIALRKGLGKCISAIYKACKKKKIEIRTSDIEYVVRTCDKMGISNEPRRGNLPAVYKIDEDNPIIGATEGSMVYHGIECGGVRYMVNSHGFFTLSEGDRLAFLRVKGKNASFKLFDNALFKDTLREEVYIAFPLKYWTIDQKDLKEK